MTAYGIIWSTFGLLLWTQAALHGGWWWLAAWPGVSFLAVGAAYVGLGPGIFGKGSDGRLAPWAMVLLGPFLLFTWSVWHLARAVRGTVPCHEVAPSLFLGRRPLRHELSDEIRLIVDMTAEFRGTGPLPAEVAYRTFPTLDAGVPAAADFAGAVAVIAEAPGPVYLHCAAGRGRSALIAAAVLIERGTAHSAEEAEELLRRIRPRVRLNSRQREALRVWVAERMLTAETRSHGGMQVSQ